MSNIQIKTLGSDPEFFLIREDEFYPSCGIIGGTKKEPKPLPESGIYGLSIQEDNVAVEITTAPHDEKESFIKALTDSIAYLPNTFPEEYNLSLSDKCSAYFNPRYLTTKQAMEFGCDPDMNAYTGNLNQMCKEAKTSNLRSCGGHVHIGFIGCDSNDQKALFIRALDLYLGIPSLILDTDTERRKLYGKAGAYREKPYGVEYRTLSNFWVFTPELIGWVWDQVHLAAEFYNSNSKALQELKRPDSMSCEKIKLAINHHNIPLALMAIEEYGIKMPEVEEITY